MKYDFSCCICVVALMLCLLSGCSDPGGGGMAGTGGHGGNGGGVDPPEPITLISKDSNGSQGDGYSQDGAASADGRYVAFESVSTNLVANDTNASADIFLHDTQMGTTTRVSVDSSGTQADGTSSSPRISADGRYVVFSSGATNLVMNDTNMVNDVFLHDTQTGSTTRVSVDALGNELNGATHDAAISADGLYVAFYSDATNLVPGDTNNDADTFVRDTQSNTTIRVSVAADGSEANRFSQIVGMSRDGRYVLFYSPATNLLPAADNMANQMFRAPNQ